MKTKMSRFPRFVFSEKFVIHTKSPKGIFKIEKWDNPNPKAKSEFIISPLEMWDNYTISEYHKTTDSMRKWLIKEGI